MLGAEADRVARRPEPSAFRTAEEFLQGLRLLRVDAGDPSLRDLARATGIPRSTLALLFDARRSRLPRLDRCAAVLRALGVAPPQVRQWAEAWKRIQGAELREYDRDPDRESNDDRPAVADTAGVDASPLIATTGLADAPGIAVTQSREAITEPLAPDLREVAEVHQGKRFGRRHLVVAFSTGAAFAVVMTLIALQLVRLASPPPPVLVGDYALCQPGAIASQPAAPDPVAAPGLRGSSAGPPRWIARPTSDKQILTAEHVTLPFKETVAEKHTLIVTLMLTSTCPGAVTVTDTRRNQYRVVADVADSSRHRVMIIAAFGVSPLTTADSLTITYPQASKYHVAVDEFSGLTASGQTATSSGHAGGTVFSTGPTPNPCTAGQLQVAAIGTNSGTAPTLPAEWTVIEPPLKLSSYYLTTSFRLTRETGPCASTGATTAQWAAALATFS
ncbi:hypothetical protein FB465_3284 [Kitasatospora atroaurantiaca]|uniref:Helix-turn-helix protein n=1 Tax=Kitasatospora atroaurantiaca TaxID=285545 RepID=A0A561ERJ0_9ACTN|nr:hypothetical protein FB465_3284 [Kitasatospora atroaurantiaca]